MLVAGSTNGTLLSALGLQNIDLTVDALLPNPSCPNGGLLNTALGLGNTCTGITVANNDSLLQTCGLLQDGSCCCSSGEPILPGMASSHIREEAGDLLCARRVLEAAWMAVSF